MGFFRLSRKAQMTAFGLMIMLMVVGLVWITGLSGWIAQMGQDMVTANSLTGLDAFFYSNLNLFIGVAWLISLIAVGRMGFS